MVSQGIANPSTGLYRCSGSNPDGGVKDICSANIKLFRVNILKLQVYKQVLWRSFPSKQKKPQKYVLFIGVVVNGVKRRELND